MVGGALALLALVTAGLAWEGSGPGSALRHLYLVPALWVALGRGAVGGGLVGLLAGLLQAPLVLPAIERAGLTRDTLDGLLSLGAPLAAGLLAGRLVDQSRARGRRLEALLGIQTCLARESPLEERLEAVAARVRAALAADRVGIVLRGEGAPLVVSDPPGAALDPRSAAAWSLRTGRTLSIGDIRGDGRLDGAGPPEPTPLRGLVLPLAAGAGSVGALAVERAGDLPGATRAAAAEVALHLALGIEHARLALRQRRFAQELAEKVEAATRRLTELDRAKSEFLSVVSHELRTPLTALQGFSELLLAREVPPERVRRFLGHLHDEARRLGRIVAELLDLSRIEAGQDAVLRREAVDLVELLERNRELFAAEHRRHRFEWEPDGPLPLLLADRDALDRIVKNLLSNAVKYSPRGGPVRVQAGPAPDRPGQVEVVVADEGVGIPPEALPRIFDKYIRVLDPETAAVRGLGLGLALARTLARAHGGEVEVLWSEPGRGSAFRLLLPLPEGQI